MKKGIRKGMRKGLFTPMMLNIISMGMVNRQVTPASTRLDALEYLTRCLVGALGACVSKRHNITKKPVASANNDVNRSTNGNGLPMSLISAYPVLGS